MINKVKEIVEVIVETKSNVIVDEIDYDFEAPTETGKEIAIDLFPKDWKNGVYDCEKFFNQCNAVYNELSAILLDTVVCDIDEDNTWNFIYVVL